MSYREKLPEGCPPGAAEEIAAAMGVFRLVRENPPTLDDFLSQRAENPRKVFSGVTECQACGLSVFLDRKDCEKLLKLAHMRGRLITRVLLNAGAGMIQQTFKPSHHTWWPRAAFDILTNCEMRPK